ncbi:hypothetical protein [Candidatus Sodalis pierantonius]|uniref:hypothetical protein n=1 Tax=Candidatus Sodalis pierantonii TaxID=1486991 RepID=UPI00056DB049|nr:hypothetical protein [Candidatus Sodalis pierantonius]
MPKKLIDAAKLNQVFAHLSESADNHALYFKLVEGNDISSQIREVTLAPGYRILRALLNKSEICDDFLPIRAIVT